MPQVKSPNQNKSQQHTMVMHEHTHHKTAQQGRGGMTDCNWKTDGDVSSEPAFDVGQVCLRARGLFGLTGEFSAAFQIERGQGGTRLEHNDVT